MFFKYNLDALFVFTHATGMILPFDTYGIHLVSQMKRLILTWRQRTLKVGMFYGTFQRWVKNMERMTDICEHSLIDTIPL